MIGSGVVSIPMAFNSAGFVLGTVISVIGAIVCSRTCILMIKTAGNDKEWFETLYKYWGKWAFYLGYIATILIMIAALCSYFIILSDMMYPTIVAIIMSINSDYKPVTITDDMTFSESLEANFGGFSSAYCALIIFFIEILVITRKDFSIFIKIIAFGTFFIVSLILFIIGYGIYGFTTTDYIVTATNTTANIYPNLTDPA